LTLAIHANKVAVPFEDGGEVLAGESAAPIGREDLRDAVGLERLHRKTSNTHRDPARRARVPMIPFEAVIYQISLPARIVPGMTRC